MENQLISNNGDLQKEIAKTIGKDVEVVSPDSTKKTQQYIDDRDKYLKNLAQEIVELDPIATKDTKIFNKLVSLKEAYPETSLIQFSETHFCNNGLASDSLKTKVKELSKKADKYIKKSNNIEDFSPKDVAKYRSRMLNALKAIGINYKVSPSNNQLLEDYENFVISPNSNSFDWDSFGESISNITDTVNKVGGAVVNVQKTIDAVKSRDDIYFNPPISPQQAQQTFINAEKKSSTTNKILLYGGVGLGAIILLIVLFKVLK